MRAPEHALTIDPARIALNKAYDDGGDLLRKQLVVVMEALDRAQTTQEELDSLRRQVLALAASAAPKAARAQQEDYDAVVADRDALRLKLAQMKVDWAATVKALGDLSYECYGVFGSCREPSVLTYNQTFTVLQLQRQKLDACLAD